MERIADGRYLNLVPSSEQGGNTTADDHGLTMTGPGSPSILPVPDTMDNLPMPQIGARHPVVWRPDHRPHVDHEGADVSGGWHEVTEGGNGGWKQL